MNAKNLKENNLGGSSKTRQKTEKKLQSWPREGSGGETCAHPVFLLEAARVMTDEDCAT
jgi:hypothetical protein